MDCECKRQDHTHRESVQGYWRRDGWEKNVGQVLDDVRDALRPTTNRSSVPEVLLQSLLYRYWGGTCGCCMAQVLAHTGWEFSIIGDPRAGHVSDLADDGSEKTNDCCKY